MCPSGYHHNGLVATRALGHMIYGHVYVHNVMMYFPLWWQRSGHIVIMITCILCLFCFCETWALCLSWITYDHLYIYNNIHIHVYITVINIYIYKYIYIYLCLQRKKYMIYMYKEKEVYIHLCIWCILDDFYCILM